MPSKNSPNPAARHISRGKSRQNIQKIGRALQAIRSAVQNEAIGPSVRLYKELFSNRGAIMKTLGDLYRLMAKARKFSQLFGVNGNTGVALGVEIRKLGDTLIQEMKLSKQKIWNLPDETPLLPKTQEACRKFEKWCLEVLASDDN